jgi:hypothetical protein
VARYSPDANLRWAQRAGGTSTDRALAIALDGGQNSYLTGFFTTEATFGTLSLEGQAKEIFLAKLSPDGAFLQAKSAGGAGVDEGRGIARDAQSTTYLTGTYQDTALFGEAGRLRELRQPTRAESDPNVAIFIAAYDANFLPIFVEGAGGDADLLDQSGNDIAVDAAGRAHVTGVAKPTALFGVGNGIVGPSPIRGSDAFLATYATGTPREVFYLSSSSGGTVDAFSVGDSGVLGDIGDGDDTEPGPPEDSDEAPQPPEQRVPAAGQPLAQRCSYIAFMHRPSARSFHPTCGGTPRNARVNGRVNPG